MKRGYISFLSALAVFVMASCKTLEPADSGVPAGYGKIIVNVAVSDCSTRSAESFDYEQGINTMQFLVFDSQGRLLCYSQTPQLEGVPAGNCEVWVVANGPDCSDVMDRSSLMNKEILLSDNSTDPAKGFVMRGSTSVTVLKDDSVPASIVLERMVSRIYVNNITNDIPDALGDIVIKSVCLANVVGSQNLEGTLTSVLWLNQCGCSSQGEGYKIDGVQNLAQVPDMTWCSSGVTILNGQTENLGIPLYGFQNEETGWSDSFPFTPRMSALMLNLSTKNLVTGSYEDSRYFIVLEHSMDANMSYFLDLTFKGLTPPFGDGNNQELITVSISSSMVNGYQTVTGGSFNI